MRRSRLRPPLRECGPCLEDLQIIRDVTALLRKHGQPPLGKDPAPGSGYRKARTRGLQAEGRINKRRRRNGMPPRRGGRRNVPSVPGELSRKLDRKVKTCQGCFTQKSMSGACLCT